MRMPEPYESIARARSPLNLFGVGVFVFMVVLGLAFAAPWWYFAPVLIGGVLLLWHVALGRDRHFRMDDSTMRWGTTREETAVPLDDIAKVEIQDWSDSTDYVIHHRDGHRTTIPATVNTGGEYRLTEALKARGILVEHG